jgi:hypothetical protein
MRRTTKYVGLDRRKGKITPNMAILRQSRDGPGLAHAGPARSLPALGISRGDGAVYPTTRFSSRFAT